MSRTYAVIGYIAGFISPILIILLVGFIRFRSGYDLIAPNQNAKNSIPDIHMQDIKTVDLSNTPVRISDYTDDLILVDFWATWCSPCIAQFPYYERLNAERKVRIIAVSDQKIENIERFKRENDYHFDFLKSTSKLLEDYKIVSIPLWFLFYKNGDGYEKIVEPDSATISAMIAKMEKSKK